MYTTTKIEALTTNETVSTAFQMATIAMVGLFSLAQTVAFLMTAV